MKLKNIKTILKKISEKTKLKGISKCIVIGCTSISGTVKIGLLLSLFLLSPSLILFFEILPVIGMGFAILYQICPDSYKNIKSKIENIKNELTEEERIEITSIISNIDIIENISINETPRSIYNQPHMINLENNTEPYNDVSNIDIDLNLN